MDSTLAIGIDSIEDDGNSEGMEVIGFCGSDGRFGGANGGNDNSVVACGCNGPMGSTAFFMPIEYLMRGWDDLRFLRWANELEDVDDDVFVVDDDVGVDVIIGDVLLVDVFNDDVELSSAPFCSLPTNIKMKNEKEINKMLTKIKIKTQRNR